MNSQCAQPGAACGTEGLREGLTVTRVVTSGPIASPMRQVEA